MSLLGRLVILCGCLVIVTPTAAQPPPDGGDTEGARALFEQGRALVREQDWSRAAERFRSAARLSSSPEIRYNLAAALFELGQLNEAEELVVALHRDDETPEELRATAWDLAGRIPAAGGEISIRVDGPDDGVEVFLDDRRIPDSRLGVAMTASIGSHIIEARRDREVLARGEYDVTRDERAVVLLQLGGDALFPADGLGATDSDDVEDDGDQSLFGDWRFWAAVGGGVLLVVAVVLIAVVVSDRGTEAPIAGNFDPGVLTWD